MDEISATLIAKALDGLNQRYRFTAQNIANANSPDYRPVRVRFEEQLRAAAAGGADAVRAVRPAIVIEDQSTATSAMRLDLELASAAQTSMRYRALVDILGRQMALHRAVAMAGR
jgi:flagellar basal-body rod protein FlgB